jgi:hypothetical protein
MRSADRSPILADMPTPSPRSRIRAVAVRHDSMRAVNSLLAVAAAMVLLAAAVASIVR